jgi:hypothetical protein
VVTSKTQERPKAPQIRCRTCQELRNPTPRCGVGYGCGLLGVQIVNLII